MALLGGHSIAFDRPLFRLFQGFLSGGQKIEEVGLADASQKLRGRSSLRDQHMLVTQS